MMLFTYGSLILPVVWEAVTGKHHRSEPAIISGFIRRTVKGHTFPAIIATRKNEDTVARSLYHDVDPESLAALDQFESDFYIRQTIEAITQENTTLGCDAYIVPPERAHLLSEELWDLEEFERDHLKEFLKQV